MTTNSELDRTHTPTRWILIGFYATSIVFNLCLIAQLLTVGVAYFDNPAWWNIHVWLVRGYGGLSLVLLGWSFANFVTQCDRCSFHGFVNDLRHHAMGDKVIC
jgi:hypothetical protein